MSSITRRALLVVLWTTALVVVYLGPAEWLARRAEGVDPALDAIWPLVLGGVLVLAAITLTLSSAGRPDAPSGRRRFLVGGAKVLASVGAVAGVVLFRLRGWLTVTRPNILVQVPNRADHPEPEWKEARIEEYRRLGRTDFRVSDVSLGSGRIREDGDGEQIAREAIDRGVNYFDTAPDYSGSGSERALGRAMKGKRDQMFVATKFCTPEGHLPAGSSVEDYMRVVEGSLERLQTDWVDLVHVHSCDTLERLHDPNLHEAFDRLKEQGKARFLGVSTHTPRLETIVGSAIDSGRFDVIMPAYHHGAWPRLGNLVERAAAADVGIVAMKTLKGAKHHGLEGFAEERDSYAQAAFKWVLSNPHVSCLVISFFDHAHLDEYLAASGQRPTPEDHQVLAKYDRLIAGKHCFAHCGDCLDACPEDLAIHDVLRYRMYAEDYGWPEEGRRLYAQLEKQADVCLACPAPCTGACPEGVPIRTRMLGAHAMLS